MKKIYLAILGIFVLLTISKTYPMKNPAVHVEDLIAEGKMKPEQLEDLGDILVGNAPVHRKEGEIVIYSVGGMPVEDVAWGTVCYRNALEKGIGTKLNLWTEPDLMK